MSLRILSALAVISLALFPGVPINSSASTESPQYTIYVTTTADEIIDDEWTSLREAILEANKYPSADLIIVPSGTYTLTISGEDEDAGLNGDLDITSNLTLQYSGPIVPTISGNAIDRVFEVHNTATDVRIEGLTITNKSTAYDPLTVDGLGIKNSGGLALSFVTMTNNASDDSSGGGGIANYGTLTVSLSTFTANSAGPYAEGGGILNRGTATITKSTFTQSYAGAGGAIANIGDMKISDSTIQNSSSRFGGAGIYQEEGSLVINSTSLILNGGRYGGAMYIIGGTTHISQSQISYNGSEGDGSGILQMGGTLHVTSTEFYHNIPIGDPGSGSGSGLMLSGGNATLDQVWVHGNQSHGSLGGGIYVGWNNLSINDSTIEGNTANQGGGLYVDQNAVIVAEHITITQNIGVTGGGVYNAGTLTLDHSAILNNRLHTYPEEPPADKGAGIYSTGVLTITNTLVKSNDASEGAVGGIYSSGTMLLSNSSVEHNFTMDYDGGPVGGIQNDGVAEIINSMILYNGSGGYAGDGGLLNTGNLTLIDSLIKMNGSHKGGCPGFTNAGNASLNRVIISDNGGYIGGGGICTSGLLDILDSQIIDNQYNRQGGGILMWGGYVTVTNSILARNNQTIYQYSGSLLIRNTTITGSENYDTGSTYEIEGGMGHLDHVTIAGNAGYGEGVGGGIAVIEGAVTLHNTILAGNTNDDPNGLPDCSSPPGGLISAGYNLVGDGTGCNWTPAPGDLVGTAETPIDPLLAPLGDHGGLVPTLPLLPGSPALDAADPAACLPADARGVPRPQGTRCDIGAYEAVYTGGAGASAAEEAGVITFTVSLSAPAPEPITITYATADGTALAGQDYLPSTGAMQFAPGESSHTIPVTLLDDSLPEPEEVFTLHLSSPQNVLLATSQAEGVILDTDRFYLMLGLIRR